VRIKNKKVKKKRKKGNTFEPFLPRYHIKRPGQHTTKPHEEGGRIKREKSKK